MSEMQFGRHQEEVFDLRHERGAEPGLFRLQFLQQRLLQHMQVIQILNLKSGILD
jgi:hypothetical protein